MSGKRRHRERLARLQARAQRDMLDARANGIAVDVSALAPCGSYSEPDFVERGFYIDTPFTCQGCGKSEVWSAAQQKWWYEVAKGDRLSTAKRCRPCRRQERARRDEARLKGGDPNPYKNAGLILAKIRSEIEPRLLSAGYRPLARTNLGPRYVRSIDYSRSDALVTISWNQHVAGLTVEFLAEGAAEVRTIAAACLDGVRSTRDVEKRLNEFLIAVRCFLDGPSEERAGFENDTRTDPRIE